MQKINNSKIRKNLVVININEDEVSNGNNNKNNGGKKRKSVTKNNRKMARSKITIISSGLSFFTNNTGLAFIKLI